MINRVLQLNISQLENSFNSLLEKHFVLDLPSQPNPNLIQLVIERGNLWSKKTRPVHERLLVNGCKKNLVLHDRMGKPVESSTHTVQEFDSPGHRDTASSNANKFNLAIDEEKTTDATFMQRNTMPHKCKGNLEECSMFWMMLTLFPQMSNFRIKKLCCMFLKTTKQWSGWSFKAEVPQWHMFPEPTELRLIVFSIELIWTPKIQIKYIDTKNQLADMLRMWGARAGHSRPMGPTTRVVAFLLLQRCVCETSNDQGWETQDV